MKKDKEQNCELCKKGMKDEGDNNKKKTIPDERDMFRRGDPCWGNQVRIQILGDSLLVVNWMKGRLRID